jgi:site-specific DNA recombinase
MNRLDAAVWEDVRGLLLDPGRLAAEHHRRLEDPGGSDNPGNALLTRRIAGLRRSMDRLIDSYQDGYLEKEEFEPRIRGLRDRLAQLETAAASAAEQERSDEGLRQVIGAIEQFATRVRERLDRSDFATRQEIIRTLVDRIEIDDQAVRIVYKVNIVPFERCPSGGSLQHCPSSFGPPGGELGGAEWGLDDRRAGHGPSPRGSNLGGSGPGPGPGRRIVPSTQEYALKKGGDLRIRISLLRLPGLPSREKESRGVWLTDATL